MSGYVLSNRQPRAVAHHRHLSDILDPYTIPRILDLRRDLTGLACLEVGAGAGSVAAWLASEVGPPGRVVATDKEPLTIPYMRQLTRVQHDITTEPVPRPPYDLIHARLVLAHLPEREIVLRTLVNALAPGGLLLIEDWDMTWRSGRVLRAPSPADKRLWETFHDYLIAVFDAAGANPGWASEVADHMIDAGLKDVGAEYHTRSWRGGEPGCRLVANTTHQLRDQLIKQGATDDELERVRDLMTDPRMMIRTPPLVSTAGWKR